jgi:hypothetical protein
MKEEYGITFEHEKLARLGSFDTRETSPYSNPKDKENLVALMFYYTHIKEGRDFLLQNVPSNVTEEEFVRNDEAAFGMYGVLPKTPEMDALIGLHRYGDRYAKLSKNTSRTAAEEVEFEAAATNYLEYLKIIMDALRKQSTGPVYSMAW